MAIQLTNDIQWVSECYTHDDHHEHVSVYLIEQGDQYILIDSGSFYHREGLIDQISAATDGQGIDALVLSHSDYPHSGNIRTFSEEWGDIELIASSGSPDAQGLPEARKCEIGGSLEVLGRTFSFIDPPLADRSHTTWIFDHGADVLFTADGFGNYHEPGQCYDTSAEFDGGIPESEIRAFHADNLVWLRYVDPGKLRASLEAMFTEHDPQAVAPIHGNPVVGDDVNPHLETLLAAATDIANSYTVGE